MYANRLATQLGTALFNEPIKMSNRANSAMNELVIVDIQCDNNQIMHSHYTAMHFTIFHNLHESRLFEMKNCRSGALPFSHLRCAKYFTTKP